MPSTPNQGSNLPTPSSGRRKPLLLVLTLVILTALMLAWQGGRSEDTPSVVVYCAHDSVYADQILRDFEQLTGIRVDVRYDTEATKSLGLTEMLLREKDSPRCDVFWNNEQLGTVALREAGVLEAYQGPGYERIPAGYKDPEGYWTGFAARMRVWIVNTDRMEGSEEAVAAALEGDLSRVAIAKPLYGTTRTHYTVLWDLMGEEGLQAWHEDWRTRQVNEVMGNATVKNLVAAGACDLGLTDTDDYYVAVDEGKPVTMVPARVGEMGSTICIPNTVSIIRGTPRQAEARLLVDYLLSRETELALSRSKSRQIPLGPVDSSELTDEVRQLQQHVDSGYALSELNGATEACLAWLKSEYLE